MEYMTLKEASGKWSITPPPHDKLPLRKWSHIWRS